MMLKELREKVYEANMALPRLGLVVFTWGNNQSLTVLPGDLTAGSYGPRRASS